MMPFSAMGKFALSPSHIRPRISPSVINENTKFEPFLTLSECSVQTDMSFYDAVRAFLIPLAFANLQMFNINDFLHTLIPRV